MATTVTVKGSKDDTDNLVDSEDTQSKADVGAAGPVQGTRSLFTRGARGKISPMDDDDMVEVVNVSLTNARFRVRDPNSTGAKGYAEKDVVLRPFQTMKIRVGDARRRFRAQERRGGRNIVMRVPDEGDCGGKTFTSDGRTFHTCPFRSCKTCGKSDKRWSPWQVQHFLSGLGTEGAITRIIQSVDTRPAVIEWGLEIIRRRRQARADAMGVTDPGSRAVY